MPDVKVPEKTFCQIYSLLLSMETDELCENDQKRHYDILQFFDSKIESLKKRDEYTKALKGATK